MLRTCLTATGVVLVLVVITQIAGGIPPENYSSQENSGTTRGTAQATAAAQPVKQQDFRVHSRVFLDDKKEPVSENLTLFSSGIVYDFLYAQPETITIFDPQRGRLILLDQKREVRTGIDTAALLDLTARIKATATGEQQELVNPKFTEEFLERAKTVILDSKRIRYEVVGEPAGDERTLAFREFADWFSRLNAIQPAGTPPFARLQLNRSVSQHNLIPKEVKLYRDSRPFARSEHLINWQLIGTDRERIDRAGRYLASFKEVGFKEYMDGLNAED